MNTRKAFEARQAVVAKLNAANDEVRSEEGPSAEQASAIEALETDLRSATEAMEAAIVADEADKRFADAYAASGFAPVAREERSAADAEIAQLEAFRAGEVRSVDLMPNEVRSLGTGAAEGADTVPSSIYGQIIAGIREFSTVLAAGATVVNTTGGNEISVPGRNAYPSAALVAEKGTYGKSNGTYQENAVLRSYKYGLISQVSNELLADSQFNIAAEVATLGGEAIGMGIGAAFMNGDGTNKPEGITTKAADDTFAGAAAITADELIDVVHSLARPYRSNAAFIIGDDTLKLIRKLKGTDGQYIWQASLTAGEPDTILGHPVYVDSEMAAPTTGNKSVLFGDIKKAFMVRFAGGVNVARSDEYGFDTDLVSWKWSTRVDSAIVLPEAYVLWDQA